MKFGLRGQLVTFTLAVFVVVGAASAAVLEVGLRAWLEDRVEATLAQHLAVAALAVDASGSPSGPEAADALVDALGSALDARVTLVAADGRVLGDSSLDPGTLAAIENHGGRPEVLAARADGLGSARRYSETLGTDMLYLACPVTAAEGPVVRVALPLDEVDRTMARLRLSLATAGLVGLAVALGMGLLASEVAARTLRGLVLRARSLEADAVGGEVDPGTLARSIARLGAELEGRMTELAAARARLAAVLDGLDAAVLVLDAGRQVTLANRAASTVLGLRFDPVGHPLADACRVPALAALAERCAGGAPAEAEIDLPERGGRTLLARVQPQPGSPEVLLVIHDITRLTRLEKVRRDFVANVSHELRTPVSVVRANVESLLDGALEDPEQARVFLEAALRNTERMARLVSDLLDLSRIEAGQVTLELEPLELRAVAERVLTTLGPLAVERGIRFADEVPPGLRAIADPRGLEQVLTNLVDNAVRYTPAGTTVQVRALEQEQTVRVEVADDGPGIEPRHLPRLFERFYRVDKGRARADGGTGLGLAIVKHLVGAMGGQVGVESGTPHGTVFWVELPRV